MKKRWITILLSMLLCTLFLVACAKAPEREPTDADTRAAETTASVTQAPSANTQNATEATEKEVFDPYAVENRYDIPSEMFEKRAGTDYGTLLTDVGYYSTIAGDTKMVNILLPAGFDEKKSYPVTYVFHGFGGDHNTHIDTDSYLVLLYGNMLADGLVQEQILVGMDMYTDRLSDKDSKTDEELRFIYDKAIEETAIDLMPFISENYPVKTGREYTAIAGMSEGGAKSLCTGFRWLDKFGYIGAFAPDTGVIPTEYYKGTFWNTPVFDEFPMPSEETTPYYLYMAVGSEDPWNIDCTLYYRDVLNEMGVKNRTDYVEGYGHDAEFWGQCFYNFLSKIFQA